MTTIVLNTVLTGPDGNNCIEPEYTEAGVFKRNIPLTVRSVIYTALVRPIESDNKLTMTKKLELMALAHRVMSADPEAEFTITASEVSTILERANTLPSHVVIWALVGALDPAQLPNTHTVN